MLQEADIRNFLQFTSKEVLKCMKWVVADQPSRSRDLIRFYCPPPHRKQDEVTLKHLIGFLKDVASRTNTRHVLREYNFLADFEAAIMVTWLWSHSKPFRSDYHFFGIFTFRCWKIRTATNAPPRLHLYSSWLVSFWTQKVRIVATENEVHISPIYLFTLQMNRWPKCAWPFWILPRDTSRLPIAASTHWKHWFPSSILVGFVFALIEGQKSKLLIDFSFEFSRRTRQHHKFRTDRVEAFPHGYIVRQRFWTTRCKC